MRTTALLAGGLILFAAPASAQTLAMHTSASNETEAAALEARAYALHDSPDDYDRAANLYLDAAALRDITDPKRITDEIMAGRLYYYSGDLSRAQSAMQRAAEDALTVGDVVTAAVSFLDAATIAEARHDGHAVIELAERARLLMETPLVTDDVKKDVLRRLDETRRVQRAAGEPARSR